ncbi:MAG TPA: TonB family protein [Bryobacteraceae bacterium]|nr:TonB family protein [Bryobacteraceae bacterium]
MPTVKSQTLSIGLHLAAVAMLLFLTSHSILAPPPATVPIAHVIPLAPFRHTFIKHSDQRAGGSNQTALPAKHGAPPPRGQRTFIPPVNPVNPKLPMPVTVEFDSPIVAVSYSGIGDPMSKYANGGLGTKGWNGVGIGCCGGIGDKNGGTPGITVGTPGHAVSGPQLIYKVEPEFSEDARKAKYSGIVLLSIVVDTNGRASGFRILQTPGLGLDQKAIEAVRQWRFKPGYQDGKPVVTGATVEVRFQLL